MADACLASPGDMIGLNDYRIDSKSCYECFFGKQVLPKNSETCVGGQIWQIE